MSAKIDKVYNVIYSRGPAFTVGLAEAVLNSGTPPEYESIIKTLASIPLEIILAKISRELCSVCKTFPCHCERKN